MAITNKFKQFDKSKTNLGIAPDNGFTPNTVAKADEINGSIYDISLLLNALVNALCQSNYYDGQDLTLDNSQTIDTLAHNLKKVLGVNFYDKKTYTVPIDDDESQGDMEVMLLQDPLFAGLPVYISSVDLGMNTSGGFKTANALGYANGKFVLFGESADSYITSKHIRMTTLNVLNSQSPEFIRNWFKNNVVLQAWFEPSDNYSLPRVETSGTATTGNCIAKFRYGGLLSMPVVNGKIYFNVRYKGINSYCSTIQLTTDYQYPYSIDDHTDEVSIVYIRKSMVSTGV